jgi:hypothetical protein
MTNEHDRKRALKILLKIAPHLTSQDLEWAKTCREDLTIQHMPPSVLVETYIMGARDSKETATLDNALKPRNPSIRF